LKVEIIYFTLEIVGLKLAIAHRFHKASGDLLAFTFAHMNSILESHKLFVVLSGLFAHCIIVGLHLFELLSDVFDVLL
jgi:hypothetical protein